MRKLNLSEWANIAEVISAAAVVVSLLYVGYQIRENTGEIRAANRQELVNRSHTASLNFATSPELSGIMAKINAGEEVSPTEQRQYAYAIRAVIYDAQEAFLLYREGRLDQGYWATRSALISVYLAESSARAAYEEIKSLELIDKEFMQWVDSIIYADRR